MKEFNITGLCVDHKHYMVDTSHKLEEILELVKKAKYFTINRGRQYGKTTTLHLLEGVLSEEYLPISISFEGVGDEPFETPENFCGHFMRAIKSALRFTSATEEYRESWVNETVVNFEMLSEHITNMCENQKIVLMIDEVDKSSNFRVYLHFLGMLRDKYLARESGKDFTFHSVILAGVYDIRNIKLKLINAGIHQPQDGEKIYTSPWNIASDFEVDMSFGPKEIATMLKDYEADYHNGMDIVDISEEIYDYTSGYPYLVSVVCKKIHEKLGRDWTIVGVQEAVKLVLKDKSTLFDDIGKNLENNSDLYDLIYGILIPGDQRDFDLLNPAIEWGSMVGIIKECNGKVVVANRVFEIRIANYFISKDQTSGSRKEVNNIVASDVIKDGRFDMQVCLRKFADYYKEIENAIDGEFIERNGRLLFLSYLRPLINGQGFYHIESQFTDLRRMDVVVDYGVDQFIIELKVWRGEKMHEDAYEQLLGYLESKNADAGYLVTFDFRKDANKDRRCKWVERNQKQIFDVIV